MSWLDALSTQVDPIKQNRQLFRCLGDDARRRVLYRALSKRGFPVIRFRSLERSAGFRDWPDRDVYLLSGRKDIQAALEGASVAPYARLDSGGLFMLGLDKGPAHDAQNHVAAHALRYDDDVLLECVSVAVGRALVLPLKNPEFNLPVAVGQQAALRFVELLFGFKERAHSYLQRAMTGGYTDLVFQIIGRHFVSETGLPPHDSSAVKELKSHLLEEIWAADAERTLPSGKSFDTVVGKLRREYPDARMDVHAELVVVVLGLMAGTVGNISAAVSIALADFYAVRDGITRARDAALHGDLWPMIAEAFRRNPPAPFLARTTTRTLHAGPACTSTTIPAGADLLLAVGADPDDDLVFGGGQGFAHRCIGRYIAVPLVSETVRRVVLLPGLSQVIDSATGRPEPLKKRWGAICESYPLRFQRDRLLNLQPLHVVLKIKEPVAENAVKLAELTRVGAHVVQEALDKSKHVHSAYFMLVEGDTHLAMMTVYDGDFEAYVEHFATDVDLFDDQLKYLADAPPTPTRQYPKQFVAWIRKYNRTPLGGYFYSAYPTSTVSRLVNEPDVPGATS